jgi:hypothetical protein
MSDPIDDDHLLQAIAKETIVIKNNKAMLDSLGPGVWMLFIANE